MSERKDVCYFHLPGGVAFYVHRECSLDPEWDEPTWDETKLIALSEVPEDEQCPVCRRFLAMDPPYYWSKMSYHEVYQAMGLRRGNS